MHCFCVLVGSSSPSEFLSCFIFTGGEYVYPNIQQGHG